MYSDIIARLESLGYLVHEGDELTLKFLIGKVTQTIKNECNVSAIPKGLWYIAVDMVCGEFLMMKKGSGQLNGLDVDAAVRQIQEGDTSVTYAIPDEQITLDWLIKHLMTDGQEQFLKFRRLAW